MMKFYIVTPSFNSLVHLQRCVRSVADQACPGVSVHHHVQDGASTDGTAEWLAEWQRSHAGQEGYTLTFESARDKGMYDAINKAWAAMPEDADITAHLNSDEQYLPSALKNLAAQLESHPEADFAITSYIVIDALDRYICHRRPIKPWRWVSRVSCEIMTCACFHRVPAFRKHGIRFDSRWKSIGDLVMYSEVVNTRPRCLILPDVWTGTFSVTGNNLGWSEVTEREWPEYLAGVPAPLRCLRKLASFCNNLKRRSCDWFHADPSSYEIYPADASDRVKHGIKKPTAHWGCRTVGEGE